MKKKIIIVITLMIIISIPIVIKITHKSEQPKIKVEEKINKKEETKKDESNEDNRTKEVEKEEVSNESKETIKSSSESNINKKNSSANNSSITKENTSTTNSSNIATKEVEVKVEEPKTQTDNKKHYIDVPDPNSYYYSFHHGHIDFSSLDECQKNSEKYLMMDVNDIYGSWCIEVQDENGKVLGAYLYLKCTSGNCDRYKGY